MWPHAAFALRVCALLIIHVCVAKTQILTPQLLLNSTACTQSQLEVPALACGFSANISLKAGSLPAQLPANTRWTSAVQQLEATLGCNGSSALQGPAGCGTDPSTLAAAVPASLDLRSLSGLFSVPPNGTLEIRGLSIVGAALPSAPFPLPASGFLALSAFRLGAGARLRLVDSFLTVPSCALLSLHQTYACGVSPSPNVTVTPSSLVVHRLTTPSLDATNVTVQCSGAAAPFPCLAASVRSGTELLAAVRSAQESSDAATAAFGKFTATLYLQLSGHILLAESVARDCPDWSTRVRIRYFKASADLFVPLLEPCPIITNMAIVLQGTEDGSTVLDLAGSTSLFSLESRAVGFSGSVELRWLRLRNPPAGPLGTLPYSLMRLPLWTFEFRRRVVGVELPAYLRVSDCVLELPPEEIAMWRYRSSLPLVPELQQHTCLVDDSFYMLEAKLPSEQPHPKDIVLTYGSGWSGSFFYQRLLLQTVVRDGIATVPAAAVTAVVPGAFPGGLPPQQHQDQQALGGGTIAAASAAAAAAAGTLLSSWPFLSAAKRAQLLAATAYIWEPSMCLLIAPGSPMGIAASQVRSVIAAAIQAADVDSMSGGVEQRAQQVACFQQANSTQNSTAVAPPAGGTNSTNSVAFSISSADSSARLPAGCMLSQDVRVLALSVDAYLDFRINIVDALAPKYNPQRQVAMYAPAMLMGEPLGARVLDLAGLMAAVRLSGPGAACMTLRHLVLIGAPPASAPPAVWVASPRPKAAPPPSAPGPPPPSPPLASSTPAATLPAGVSLAGPATQTADHRRRRRRRLGSNRRLAQQASVAATSPPPPHQAAGVLAGMTQGLAPALTNFTSCLWTFEFSRSPEALAADLAGGAGGRPAGLPRLFLDSVVLVVPEAELQLLGRVWAASADMLSGRLAFSADTDPGLAAALRAMLEGSQLGGGSGSGSSANQGTVSLWFPVLSWCGYVGLNVTLTSALPAAAADEYGQSTAAGTLIPPVMQLPWVRMAAPSPATPPGQAIGDDPSAGGVPTAGNVRLPAGPLGFEPGASPRGDPPPATRQLPHSAATATSQSPAHGLASPPESSPGVLISSDQGSTSTSNGTGGSNASGSGIPFMRSVLVPCLVSGVVVGLAAAAVTWECRRRRRRDQQALPQKQLGPDKGVQIESSRNACDGGQLPNSSLEAPSGSDVVHAAATFPTSGSGRSGGGGVAVLLAVAPSGNPRSSKRHKLWKPDIHSSGNATPNSSPRASSQSSGGLRRAMLNMLHALEHSRQQLSHASQAPIGTGETKGPAAGLSAATGGTAASTDGFVPTRPGTDKYGSSHQTQQHEHESLPLGCPEPPPVLAITGELGRGAQGVVYRGVWRGLDVAVKSVLFHLEPGPGGAARDVPVQRAVQEAAIAVSMAHPNIVATYTYQLQPLQAQAPNAHSEQWVRTGNDSYLGTTVDCTGSGSGSSATPGHAAEAEVWKLTLIQELCDANSLRHCLQSGLLLLGRQAGAGAGVGTGSDAGQSTALQPPPARTMLLLACDIARGLAHLHERGVVHADLSSNNVLLQSTAGRPPRMSAPGATGGGPPAPNSSAVDTGLCVVAKLCDFGLSGRLDVEADATHLSGPARRSSAYSAPELVAHGRSGPAGDVYAFAVVLWELALGLPLPVALVRPESAGLRAWQSEQARLLPLGDDDLNASGTGGQASDVALASLALPPGLLWWPPGTPAGLVSLVAECLRPEPRSRPPAAAVLQRLQARLLSPQGVGEERQGSRHWKGILGIMTALLGFE